MTIGLMVVAANYVSKHVAFDMDIIRSQHEVEIKRYFTVGCLEGTEYPDEYKKPTSGFNTHSQPMYCEELRAKKEQEMINSMVTLGKTKYDYGE